MVGTSSPTTSFHPSSPLRTTMTSGPASARFLDPDDEDDEDLAPPNHRTVSFPVAGPSGSTSVAGPSGSQQVSPPTRYSATNSVPVTITTPLPQNPRLTRSATYQSTASLAPPSSSDAVRGTELYRAWKEKYKPTVERQTELRSSATASLSQDGSPGKGGNAGIMDLDPDANYYKTNERVGGWDDESDDELGDENGINGAFRLLGRAPILRKPSQLNSSAPASPEGRERLEWQTMLASVLGGEILKGEKSRIGGERPSNETFRKELGDLMWWQIRARVRGRTEEEERRRVEERRNRVVDSVLEEVERFSIELGAKRKPAKQSSKDIHPDKAADWISAAEDSDDIQASEPEGFEKPAEADQGAMESKELKENNAMEQVDYILEKLALVESLYPHHLALRSAKPLYDSEQFQARVDALAAWSSIVRSLKAQLSVLQKWTGSDELDITKPNTTKERALVGKNRYHPLDTKARAHAASDQAADDSTFIERVLKEDSLQRTFERRAFVEMTAILYTAKQTVISHLPLFKELSLPDFQYELVRLISFPGRLIIEALRVRLDAARKLVDPSSMVIDDMIDNFRISISLGILVKRQYMEITASDPEGRWEIPYCLVEDYDSMILQGIKTFFRLLHWKLKRGGKALYFRETEILENEWEFLYDAADAIEGGDAVVAELFCSLTNKLMVRVTNFFETQLIVPVSSDDREAPKSSGNAISPQPQRPTSRVLNGPQDNADPGSWQHDKAYMNSEHMVNWFSKILDAVKMRYRKLQRFARRLTQRFDNSAEYALEDQDLNTFIDCLHDTGHFLVYTQTFEEQGTYVIADGSLWGRPDAVHHILSQSFSSLALSPLKQRRAANTLRETNFDYVPEGGILSSGGEDGGEDEEDISSYVLLVSPRQRFVWTGPVMPLEVTPLDLCLDDNRVRLIADGPLERLALCKALFVESFLHPDGGEPLLELECIVEQQSHLPRVQRELKKINRSTIRLSECIVISASHVRDMLGRAPGTQDLIENWYMFASEHGHRVGAYMDPADWATFTPLLMQLSISWVSFICDDCDPTDRKTFRWTVNALEYAMGMTRGNNILHLDKKEFARLRSKVASCMTLLISHFDILGARSSIEAKKEAERLEAVRRLQRLQENFDNTDGFLSRTASPPGHKKDEGFAVDRSIRLVREERLRLIAELEQHRLGLFNDQHLIGQVLDEEVAEDRSLVFLAASSSNIALRWQQGGFIGGGANGNVYIGFNLDSGGIMAVKEIRVQDLSNSPALYKQIKDESDVMQMLSHPNIVDYYGIEVHRDRVYIFEEYCEGGSLANLLEHGRIEDEDVILVYTVQMLEGLAYLHSKGVEHRDVKPDNILIGAGSTIKYVDFGAAKVIIKGNRTMAKTRAANKPRAPGMDGPAAMNSLAGTPMYMAPEVIKNERTTRLGAMDVWSLGCVVLEFATGRKPWSNLDNEWAIMFHIGIATQHPPLPEPGQLSDIGIDFIELCLSLDPADRPTASELLLHPWVAATAKEMREHNSPEYSYGPGSTSLPSAIADQTEGDYGDQGNYDYEEGYEEEAAIDLSHFNTPVEESTTGGGVGQ